MMDSKGRTLRSPRLQKRRRNSESESYEPSSDEEIEPDLLDGLHVEDNYVRIDSNLIKRLKREEPEPEDPSESVTSNLFMRFPDCPEYVDMLVNGTPVTKEELDQYAESIDPNTRKIGEMVSTLPLEFLALQRSTMKQHNFEYRYTPDAQPRVTNQYYSGRCWMFASLNVLRYGMQIKHNLHYTFEFSAAYLFFYDKIERANVFLEGIWSLRDKAVDDRYLQEVFTSPASHMIQDGGYWQYFKNLVAKYGIVPKEVYNDSYNCLVSDGMNDVLTKILNQMALNIRDGYERDGWEDQDYDEYKEHCSRTIYDLMIRFMGEPPKLFDWQYKDYAGSYHDIKDLTPMKFFRVHVPHEFGTKMTFIHDPRDPSTYYKPYHVEYATNMVGAEACVFINLPLDVFKAGVAESQRSGEPCWFGCDVGASLDYDEGVMDTERFDYERLLGVNPRNSKVDMLRMKTTLPTHAMVINGVDMDEPREGQEPVYRKWRVENSWGIQCEMEWHPDHGCWQMSDKWFDQHVFMAVIDLRYFDQDTYQKILDNKSEKFIVKPWDVFGTVATHSGCEHCKTKLPLRKELLGLSHH